MIKEQQTIKQLSSQLEKVKGDLAGMRSQLTALQNEYKLKKDQAEELEKKIKRLNEPIKPTVSEHAIVRYFERVEGYNIQEVCSKILSPDVMQLINTLGGNGEYPLSRDSEHKAVIKNNTVVTIV